MYMYIYISSLMSQYMHCPLSIRTEPRILVCLEMMGNGTLAYQGLYIYLYIYIYKIILSLMSEVIHTPNPRGTRRESGALTTDLSRLPRKLPDFVGVHGRVLESESHCTRCVCLLLSLAHSPRPGTLSEPRLLRVL